ncbi:MAG: Hsp20/alpha crystallin family protein [Cyanobacteria bacterium]|nr:Hsp20/alpha crystallin family protein [Cyanobacteriota bacterium]
MQTSVLEKKEDMNSAMKTTLVTAPINLYETGDSFILLVELPGVDETAIQVNLESGVLNIEAKADVELPEGAVKQYSEMRLGTYRRTVELKEKIDVERIDATYKGGLLKLTLPKNKSSQSRKIQIKSN